MTKQNVKSSDKTQILKNWAVFETNSRKNESRNPLIYFRYKSSGVMFYILSDSDQMLSISFCEECQKTLQNGLKLQNRFVYHDPWHVKSSESNISIYYKASIVSYSLRKDGWYNKVKYTRNCSVNVSNNSKPDHPPRAIFLWANSPPPGKKGVQNPHPRAYNNELKPHPWGIFSIIHYKNMKKWDRNHVKLQDFIIFI